MLGHFCDVVEHPFQMVFHRGLGFLRGLSGVVDRTFDSFPKLFDGRGWHRLGEVGEVAGRNQGKRTECMFERQQPGKVVVIPIRAHFYFLPPLDPPLGGLEGVLWLVGP